MKARPPAPISRPKLADKISLWLSDGRTVDGLWIGTMQSPPEACLRRVENALHLIKRHSPLHYSRVIRNLQRIWVWLLPGDTANYERSLDACVIDPRFALAETTTIEQIASVIVHESTHARLEHCGIAYEEALRPRIEAVCIRREISFAKKLPNYDELKESFAEYAEQYGTDSEFFSDVNFRERRIQGETAAFQYLGVPDSLVRYMRALRSVLARSRGIFRRTQP